MLALPDGRAVDSISCALFSNQTRSFIYLHVFAAKDCVLLDLLRSTAHESTNEGGAAAKIDDRAVFAYR